MRKIPLISKDPKLAGHIVGIVEREAPPAPEIVTLTDTDEALDYLDIEMPDLGLLHFAEPPGHAEAILQAIRDDPWLISGGVLVLCDEEERADELASQGGANLIAVLHREALDHQLPRVIEIVRDNRRILFQREVGVSLGEFSGQFMLRNDMLEARVYTNLVCNFLYNAGRVDESTRDRLSVAIYELLINGIEHGNCGISYEEKRAWLEEHRTTESLLAERRGDPAIDARRVHFEYTIRPDRSAFQINDEGDGFDWRALREEAETAGVLEAHGRGILMADHVTEGLHYNEKGNQVRFEIVHRNEGGVIPAFAEGMEPRKYAAGETVFREGDPSGILYYIATGRYEVRVGGYKVVELVPDDMFLGDVSFLLNHPRSTTAVAVTDGTLIEIPRKVFVRAVKDRPHYGLQFARMLARKIDRRNQQAAIDAGVD